MNPWRNWWVFVARGVLVILFAGMALALPAAALLTLIWLFGIYAGLTGLVAAAAAAGHGGPHARGVFVLQALVGIGAAAVAFGWPRFTATVLLYLIAWWALLTGATELIAAVRLRRVITGEWRLAVAGVASIVFALVVFIAPAAGSLAVWLLIVTYAFVFGTVLIAHGLMLRRMGDAHPA